MAITVLAFKGASFEVHHPNNTEAKMENGCIVFQYKTVPPSSTINMAVDESSKPQCKHQWTIFDEKCSQCGMTFEEYRKQVYKHTYVNKCTCGAEKAGFDSHSHWCDKKETR